jgi:hypothetical protein
MQRFCDDVTYRTSLSTDAPDTSGRTTDLVVVLSCAWCVGATYPIRPLKEKTRISMGS